MIEFLILLGMLGVVVVPICWWYWFVVKFDKGEKDGGIQESEG